MNITIQENNKYGLVVSSRVIAEELEKNPKVIDNSFQRIKRKSELWLSTY